MNTNLRIPQDIWANGEAGEVALFPELIKKKACSELSFCISENIDKIVIYAYQIGVIGHKKHTIAPELKGDRPLRP